MLVAAVSQNLVQMELHRGLVDEAHGECLSKNS